MSGAPAQGWGSPWQDPARDPAVAFMTTELVSRLLVQVDDPERMASILVAELRSLTGARLMVLLRPDAHGRLVPAEINPERRRDWLLRPGFDALCERAMALPDSAIWEPASGPAEAGILAGLGINMLLAVPLRIAGRPAGLILALDLPGKEHQAGFAEVMTLVSRVMALALRNADMLAERERIIAERTRELRERTDFLARLIAMAPVGIALVRDNAMREANARMAEICGRPAAELVGLRPELLLPEEDRGRTVAALGQAGGDDGRLASGPVPGAMLRPDGSRREVLLFISPLSPGNPAQGAMFMAADVTEQAAFERVLRESQKMDAIGQLAGGIAHDFNNQLGVIIGYADTLERALGDERQRRYAGRILASARRSADLTRKLLDFARKGQQRSEPVDCHAILNEVAAMLERSFDRRIRIDLSLAAPRAGVLGDGTQLQNAVLNLCINARDAMPHGGVLRLSTAVVPRDAAWCGEGMRPGDYLAITVADTGTGIPPEVMPHIFDPFFTTKPVGKGTGLGLSAVWGAVGQHGGRLQVETVLGTGTAFILHLPLLQDGCIGGDGAVASGAITGSGIVLVIDDEEPMRRVLAVQLEQLGYSPICAEDGRAAIAMLAGGDVRPALAILDMNMPDPDGEATFPELRRLRPGLPVLICSGSSAEGAVARLISQGAAGFLAKPADMHALARSVAAAMGACAPG